MCCVLYVWGLLVAILDERRTADIRTKLSELVKKCIMSQFAPTTTSTLFCNHSNQESVLIFAHSQGSGSCQLFLTEARKVSACPSGLSQLERGRCK